MVTHAPSHAECAHRIVNLLDGAIVAESTQHVLQGLPMFSNYLIVALRNLVRHKLYSLITLSGLAVGLACAIFIILFVHDELSWDRWLPGTERLYQVETTFTA